MGIKLYLIQLFYFGLIFEINGFQIDVVKQDNVIFNGEKLDEQKLHTFLDKHEEILLFGENNKDINYRIVDVTHKKRSRRTTDKVVNFNIGETQDDIHQIILKKSNRLIDDAFVFIRRFGNTSEFILNPQILADNITNCFYRSENSAFDVCDGKIKGIFHKNGTNLIIHPLPDRFGKTTHILMKSSTIPTNEYKIIDFNENVRLKRSNLDSNSNNKIINIPNELHIETAIFVDRDLYKHMAKNYPQNTETNLIRFVLAMVNGVQLLYHHPSLGHKINFVLKRLEILHTDPKDLRRSSDIDIFLNSFCSWQRKLNPMSDSDVVHFDHAVILTGLDLYVVSKNGKVSSQVVGLAPVAGMCTTSSSCTINEGKHFESVYVVAHEIGHNLGMRHDTSDSSCDPSLYIMSPTLGSGKITWSKCSREYLDNFLNTPQSKCLFDRGHFGATLDHSAEGKLPGERFDADQQCMLKYGKDSIRSRSQHLNDICKDLHCQRDRYTWTSHPALEGTYCGDLMWCRSGVCTLKSTFLESYSIPRIISNKIPEKSNLIDDRKFGSLKQELISPKISYWTEWGNASECESGCLYGESGRLREGSAGLKIYSRSCIDYRYRKKCVGNDKKYESCTAKQCYNIPRTTILEFSNQICQRAKEFDNEVIGKGIQKVGATPEDSCMVYCETKSGEPKSRTWTFPDGSTCRNQNSELDDNYYCVAGRCEKFTCLNVTTNLFKLDPAFCPQNFIIEDRSSVNNNHVQQENGRDYKSEDSKNNQNETKGINAENETIRRTFVSNKDDFNKINVYNQWRLRNSGNRNEKINNNDVIIENKWHIKSGCHFSCMDLSKGVQIVESKFDISTNIQLCTPETISCERLQTTYEFGTNLCTKYKLKVRGLSGNGMQISPSVEDPDRSCKVACQDEYIYHRFYLVTGDQGYFPFGTKCSKTDNRYCINGKCLEFGEDNIPLKESHFSLAVFRSKRDLRGKQRFRRNFLYYTGTNITERIDQHFLDKIAFNINFSKNRILMEDSVDLQNPIYLTIKDFHN